MRHNRQEQLSEQAVSVGQQLLHAAVEFARHAKLVTLREVVTRLAWRHADARTWHVTKTVICVIFLPSVSVVGFSASPVFVFSFLCVFLGFCRAKVPHCL